MSVHVLGVRHHGPGSARSVVASLKELKPDCILVEGPPEGDALLSLAMHKEMQPPVALLIYATDDPKRAVYYPFAEFSPEWQAIRYGLGSGIPVRFMDLPQSHRLAEKKAEPAPAEEDDEEDVEETPRVDPLRHLAEAAGYSDSERWWEHFVEERGHHAEVFAAILEAMTELRAALPEHTRPLDLLREAHMRQVIRAAEKEFERVAVICGAWHAPALHSMPSTRDDASALKNLEKIKTSATWVPWTYGRLTFASGYGAGVHSPGWYHHLFSDEGNATISFMTNIARVLREEKLDASSAHIIESVRLAEALAAMRTRPIPGLPEIMESAESVLCHGESTPLKMVRRKLLVGERMGVVPEESPTVPLQQDLARLQKKLRLPPEATRKELDLDQRKETDLERSRLLHRLSLLGIEWGVWKEEERKTGTFHEYWLLEWKPELAISVVEASRYGNTVEDAALNYAVSEARAATDLPRLSELLGAVLLADLPASVPELVRNLESTAALTSDVTHLMQALPKLANTTRYGNVRNVDTGLVKHVVDGLVARICIGLPGASASLNDDAAESMLKDVLGVEAAIRLLQDAEHQQMWQRVLSSMLDQQGLHGLLAGRACRLLLDSHAVDADEAARRLGLALSRAIDPAGAAAWLDGFLRGSGALLLHDETLWNVVDAWVSSRSTEDFTTLLPLVRRTFTTFEKAERRRMGERVKQGEVRVQRVEAPTGFNTERADGALPLLAQLLGIKPPGETP